MAPTPQGEPVPCVMCGKAVIYGLIFEGKNANQAMRVVAGVDPASDSDDHVVLSRVHVDRELCAALGKKTYEELERPRRATLSEAQVGGVGDDAVRDALPPVVPVGLDQAGNG